MVLPAREPGVAPMRGITGPNDQVAGKATAGLLLVTAIGIGLHAAGWLVDTPAVTAAASVALLIFGLPHGTFDLALLRQASAEGFRTRSGVVAVALYLGCAAGMYLVWQLEPLVALAAFLLMAVAHFAEDWEACGSRVFAFGIAAALVSAPALLHMERLGSLFVALAADPGAAVLAHILQLVAPAALAMALFGLGLLWRRGRRSEAISAGCALAALLLLPPVLGFALFFCLVHSPMQFRAHAGALGLQGFRQWARIVVPLSLAGLGIAAGVFALSRSPSIATGLFASSFMTLSILTVPHMLVPPLLRQLAASSRSPLRSRRTI
jgi:Brp/Blh family beta-carotene 15,15'-monooxygenase